MRYVPYDRLGDTPNIVVDGFGNAQTRLCLSHWPRSGTPAALLADTSAQIVFRWLDRPELRHTGALAVSNNHFDEDGLIGVFAVLEPEEALRRRALLEDASRAGDFGTFRTREGARLALAIGSFGEASYEEMLPRVLELADHPERFRERWAPGEARIEASLDALRAGTIVVEEIPALDLAIVTLPEGQVPCHPMALHGRLKCYRVLTLQGRRYELRYRYESWVQYMSARVPQRVDLAPLAGWLSELEGGVWEFEGVDAITPRLWYGGAAESHIPPERMIREVTSFLSSAPPAWDPFAP